MAKVRFNYHDHVDSAIWARINKKITPAQMTQLQKTIMGVDIHIDYVKKQFCASDKVLSILEKADLPDWTNLYNDQTSTLFVQILSDILNVKQSLQNPINFAKELLQKKSKDVDKEKARKRHIEMILSYRVFALNMICLLIYSKETYQLIKEAKDGNDASLFKIIRIDKTIISTNWVAQRIRKESLKANTKFFKKLATALGKETNLRNTYMSLKQTMFLAISWALGFHVLTDEEMCVLFSKFDMPETDPDTLRVTRHRLGLTHSKLQKTDFTMLQQTTSLM